MRKHGLISALLALALTACGGGENAFQGGSGGGGTGGSGGTTRTPAALTLTSSIASIPADGSASADIKALVLDGSNVVIGSVPVTLSTSSGALSVGTTATGADGVATAQLTTGGDGTPRNITVTAQAGGFTSTVVVAVGATSSSTTPASLTLTASAASIPADGSVTAAIQALVLDSNNIVVAGVPVTLTASSGALSAGSTTTGPNGVALANLTTGGNSTPRNITVTARAGTFTSTVTVSVGGAASSNPVNALTMTASSATIPSNGSATATVTAIARDASNLLMAGVPVSFTSDSGGLVVTQGVTDINGRAMATLSTAGDSSSRNITVTASAGGRTATSVVAVAPTSSSNAAASLVVTSSVASIPANGSVNADIQALVRDTNNVVVGGVPVTFTASSGALSTGSTNTGANGVALATLTTGGNSTPRNIVVTAHAGSFTSTVTVAVGGASSSAPVAALTMMTSATTIPSDGSVDATIVAIARDSNNLLMSGVPVSFLANSGGLEVTQGVTGSNGQAIAKLSTAGDGTPRTITVTANAGGLTSNVAVAVAPTSSSNTVRIGSGSGGSFVPNTLGVAVPSLSAGGSTSIVVSIVRQDGTLYTSPVTLNFNSPCVAAGTAAIQPQASTTTTTGQATVTYAALGCSGPDVITATTNIGSQNLSASGTVTVAPATIGSIIFVSATPTNIALKGTGETGRPETSTVVFRVQNSSSGPVANAQVAFSLSTTVGGIVLTSPTATSDSQGNVQAIVNAGTVATPVTVSATVVGSSGIATQSTQLTISTGIPTAGSFSLAASCNNIEGLDYDGTIASITARLADRFSNPAPNGTAVSFQAEGGSILPQCTTTTNANEGGVCSVDFRSSNPRPADGRISLLATAIGEESFVDANGNGVFDTAADTFGASHDLGEPWLDLNESGTYNLGEPFYDFYNNGSGELGIRNGPDGLFNGTLCSAGAKCPTDPLKRSAGIGARQVIILSGSNPVVSLASAWPASSPLGSRTMVQNSALTIDLWIRDVNGNPMPGNTNVAGAASGAGLAVATPDTSKVPCSVLAANQLAGGITRFQFVVTSGATAGTGSFTVTVTTPKGNATSFTITITVT